MPAAPRKPIGPDGRGTRASPSLQGQLTWLVLAALVPFVLLLAGIVFADYRAAREAATQIVLEVARGTAVSIERELRGDIASMAALALSPSLASDDLGSFRVEAETLARRQFAGASIALMDLSGRTMLTVPGSGGTLPPLSPNPELLARARASRLPVVSDVFRAGGQDGYAVAVAAPVFGRDGEVRAVLALSPSLQTFADIVQQQRPKPGWVVSVLDRTGVVVARTPQGDRYVGHPALDAFRRLLDRTAEGTADVVALDGSALLAGWSRPGPTGWSVAIGIPYSQFYPALWRTLALTIAGSVLTLLSAVALAKVVAGRIARPVQALARHATMPVDVTLLPAPTLGLREADTVLAALHAATRERQAAERRLRDLEAESRAELGRRIDERTGELRAAQAQLMQAQRMEAVGQLTAGVAHDFNNLLQAQMSCLELLLPIVKGQERATKYATLALESAGRGAKLTHSLLSFSRKQVLRPEAVVVPALLERLHQLLSRTLDPAIQLIVDVAPDIAPVMADPAQLEAALLNLCLNARDAMLHAAAESVTVERGLSDGTRGQGRANRLRVEAANGADTGVGAAPEGVTDPRVCVVLAVSDEGSGMDAETLARACEPFFTTKGVGRGSGLGLSMVQGFARQSGGGLTIQSSPGAGTRIEIWLPRAAPSRERAHGTDPASGGEIVLDHASATTVGARTQGRVLLVDDEPLVREVLGESLKGAGFTVVLAADGAEGLKALGLATPELGYDILVTDYAMPGLSGGELVTQARQISPKLPVLLVTGYRDAELDPALPDGVEIIRKPAQSGHLADCVARLIEAARLQSVA